MTKEDINIDDLVEEHSDYLLSFAMSKLHDLELAKDLVQDSLLSAITKIDTFKKESKLRTWLTSILNRKIIDHWRKAETRYTDPVSEFFDQEDKHHHWILDKGSKDLNNIEATIEKEETLQELAECIDKLPDQWKGIVTQKYLEEQKGDEICKEFNITSSNLWVIIHRAKLLLRDCLSQKDI